MGTGQYHMDIDTVTKKQHFYKLTYLFFLDERCFDSALLNQFWSRVHPSLWSRVPVHPSLCIFLLSVKYKIKTLDLFKPCNSLQNMILCKHFVKHHFCSAGFLLFDQIFSSPKRWFIASDLRLRFLDYDLIKNRLVLGQN